MRERGRRPARRRSQRQEQRADRHNAATRTNISFARLTSLLAHYSGDASQRARAEVSCRAARCARRNHRARQTACRRRVAHRPAAPDHHRRKSRPCCKSTFFHSAAFCRHGTGASNDGTAAKESRQIPMSAILRPSVPRHFSAPRTAARFIFFSRQKSCHLCSSGRRRSQRRRLTRRQHTINLTDTCAT